MDKESQPKPKVGKKKTETKTKPKSTKNLSIEDKIKEVNRFLKEHEPRNVYEDKYSGFTKTGYKPQWIIAAMNKVMGIDGWWFEEQEMKVVGEGVIGEGDNQLVIAKVAVGLKGVERPTTARGQSRINKGNLGDAMKGAQTDALKKALAYFSIGQRAYFGLLKAAKE